MFWVEHAFHPILTAVSSLSFRHREEIALEEGLVTSAVTLRRLGLLLMAALLTLACTPAFARGGKDRGGDGHGDGGRGGDQDGTYRQTNLVSNLPGVALLQDTNLVNAWGMSFNGTSPFWISDNGSGLSTLYAVTYDTNGVAQVAKQGL